MAEERVQRRLAAILAADVVGYSRLMGEDEAGTLARLRTLRQELLDPKVAEYGGRVVKTMGDGVLVEFPSAVDAVQHAIDVQRAIARRNDDGPPGQRLELRIGINVGDVIVEGDDIYGDGVNVASRLETVAEPGGICISGMVRDNVRNRLDIAFEDLGEQSLKNIAEPLRVFRIDVKGPDDALPSDDTDALFRRPAVAVLPFQNLGGDVEQDYFADGLTEDIITALSLWKSFPVIARNSTFAYKGKSPDIREVGRELGARYVIEGSVRKAGNRVRVTAQLINAETGHHVWAERYDRELEDIFAMQDEMTQRIAATVTPELERTEHTRAVETKPRDLGAWDYFLRGWALLKEFTPDATDAARALFEKAIAIEPNYSRPYTGLACACCRTILTQSGAGRRALSTEAATAARRAVELDPSDSEAHQYLSIASVWMDEHDQAIAEARRAIELNPSNHGAYASLGHQLALAGRPDEGIPFLEKGLKLSPQDARGPLFQSFMARSQLIGRHYEAAADWARRAVQSRPNLPEPQLVLAACLGHKGDLAEARAALDACERIRPGFAANPDSWYPIKLAADREHFLDGLRKAGLQD